LTAEDVRKRSMEKLSETEEREEIENETKREDQMQKRWNF